MGDERWEMRDGRRVYYDGNGLGNSRLKGGAGNPERMSGRAFDGIGIVVHRKRGKSVHDPEVDDAMLGVETILGEGAAEVELLGECLSSCLGLKHRIDLIKGGAHEGRTGLIGKGTGTRDDRVKGATACAVVDEGVVADGGARCQRPKDDVGAGDAHEGGEFSWVRSTESDDGGVLGHVPLLLDVLDDHEVILKSLLVSGQKS